jgi:hypothetical protein
VRGSRGGNFPEMITLAQEAEVNRLLFKHEGTGAHHEALIHISPQPLTRWN